MRDGSDHDRVIATAARETLGPLGLIRKGRSRTWLDDNDWWLGVVEFQPSSWKSGSYLNVGAMWLWRNTDDHHISFGFGYRIDGAGFAAASEAAFEDAVAAMAVTAAEHVRLLRERLTTVDAVAAILCEQAEREKGWPMWDAAVALGLAGQRDEAAAMFRAVADDDDDRDWWGAVKRDAAKLAELVRADPADFDATVRGWIDRYRDALKLPRGH